MPTPPRPRPGSPPRKPGPRSARTAPPARTTLVLATANSGKLREIRRLLGTRFHRYRTLADLGLPSPDETGTTYEDNARLKAVAAARASGHPALGDDSGLEVAALDGRPGVASARYAPDAESRIDKLLAELDGVRARRARFVCVVALAWPDGRCRLFRGTVSGRILLARRGRGGFGYDPIFHVAEKGRAMAELSDREKDSVSHRGRALARLVAWLDARPDRIRTLRP